MKTLGIDYGEKRVGLSISVPLMNMAVGYAVLDMDGKLLDTLQDIVMKENISMVVIGLPKRMDNTIGPSAKHVFKFAEELKKVISVKIEMWDERLTSKQAGLLLRDVNMSQKSKRGQLNITSAQLILQSYLDAQQVKATEKESDEKETETPEGQ